MDRETEKTRKRYNRASRVYDLMDRMVKPELRAKVLSQAQGMVLEVGVGTGKNLPYYTDDCIGVTGIDLSPGMLSKAKARAQEAKALVKLYEMDAQNMEFPDDSFDTVVATCVFCSVSDPIKGLREIRRVCKPNGKIILLEHVRSDNPILGKIMDILDPLTVRFIGPHINRRTVANVKAAGLGIRRVEDQRSKILKLIVAKP
ncbi:Methyltransferase type 11 [Acididesulfobacillus acetoxydans]|uniref:Methyltransferase type 11 n=1 Tax=Acididesulfobacillus acetoxydans TaxID=1561005 RepID=A0A8S0XBS9_9FIRM|nr:class I SAM-dependent methyltransferase [Acididesulfobacillus acetoxydans]CAA7601576.1 Methyltransferase type 11 [Acididesulfobacillus acetoxydans]CEJ07063.1 Response regulator receiver protein [Acididesulfobacillus acetoxydans]